MNHLYYVFLLNSHLLSLIMETSPEKLVAGLQPLFPRASLIDWVQGKHAFCHTGELNCCLMILTAGYQGCTRSIGPAQGRAQGGRGDNPPGISEVASF